MEMGQPGWKMAGMHPGPDRLSYAMSYIWVEKKKWRRNNQACLGCSRNRKEMEEKHRTHLDLGTVTHGCNSDLRASLIRRCSTKKLKFSEV